MLNFDVQGCGKLLQSTLIKILYLMKKLIITTVFFSIFTCLYSSSTSAQETQHEKEAHALGLPSSREVAEKAMADAKAAKERNDREVERQRAAEKTAAEAKARETKPKESPQPTRTPKASKQ